MKNFVEKGNRMAYVNTTGVAILAGAIVLAGSIIGIAETDIAIAGTGTICVEGVYSLDKTSGLVITQGDRLFYSTSTGLITKTATDKPIGTAFESELAGSTTVNVNIYENSPEGLPQAAVLAALTENSTTIGGSNDGNIPDLTATAATLTGTLTGTADGVLANVADVACGGSTTPSATDVNTAVNGAILDVNLQLKEIQTVLNAVIADNVALRAAAREDAAKTNALLTALKNAGIMASA